MEDNKIIRLVYTFFVGLLIALFVGVGTSTFYTGPVAPKFPATEFNTYGKDQTDEQIAKQKDYDKQMEAYIEKSKPYSRNLSIMALVSAVILLTLSIVFEKRIKVLADGVMLGGLFTLIYGIIRGFMSDNNKYVFVVITVGLAVVLFLGYHRFVRSHEKQSSASAGKNKK